MALTDADTVPLTLESELTNTFREALRLDGIPLEYFAEENAAEVAANALEELGITAEDRTQMRWVYRQVKQADNPLRAAGLFSKIKKGNASLAMVVYGREEIDMMNPAQTSFAVNAQNLDGNLDFESIAVYDAFDKNASQHRRRVTITYDFDESNPYARDSGGEVDIEFNLGIKPFVRLRVGRENAKNLSREQLKLLHNPTIETIVTQILEGQDPYEYIRAMCQ